MPNLLAYIVLWTWPLVTWWLFTRYDTERAIIYSVVAGYLILPHGVIIDMPLIPAVNKETVVAVGLLLALLWQRHAAIRPFAAGSTLGSVLVVMIAVSPLITAINNPDPLFYGEVVIAGLTVRDGIATSLQYTIIILPFIIARQFLTTEYAHRVLLTALAVGGLVYTIPVLWEIRMSPQLSNQFFGFFPSSFIQQYRAGGFRAVVFLGHGLYVATFLVLSLAGIFYLSKHGKEPFNRHGPLLIVFMLVVIVFQKSWGGIIYATLLTAIVLMLRQDWWLRIAVLIAAIIMVFPVIRYQVPTDTITASIAQFNLERAGSLDFRFNMESLVLDKAWQRPIFGWGGYGRNFLPGVVVDGTWQAMFTVFGWFGYIGQFGVLCLPIWLVYRRSKTMPIPPETAMLTLLLAINMVDMIPNSWRWNITWIIAGSLLAWAERSTQPQSSSSGQAAHKRLPQLLAKKHIPAIRQP